jgi:SAM-dependent methyltransferase
VKASYWDSLHESFEDAVFDPVGSDVRGAFWRALDRFSAGARRAADYGCGTGRQLPALAARFESVVGLDFAPRLVEVARRRCAGLDNVEIAPADLRRSALPARNIELGVCVNAWIMPRIEERTAMLRAIRRSLAPGAPLVLIVPSLEAGLYANERLIEWNRRSGLRGASLMREGIAATAAAARDLLQGVIDLDGSRTKHFLREEAHSLLRDAHFEVVHEERIEYPWETYFDDPPRWLVEPLPWDWLFVARRSSRSEIS